MFVPYVEVGFAKVAGNYAASLLAQTNANKLGYDQVLWLDGVEQKYVEEVGSMNIFFVENGKIVTPALNGSILPGITRKSIIQLAEDLGYEVEERKVSIDELFDAYDKVNLQKYLVQVLQRLFLQLERYAMKTEKLLLIIMSQVKSLKNYDTYTGIQSGKLEDKYGWRVLVPEYK